jgi:DNA modification methylase
MGLGLKDKDLMMMPHRVAIALQIDGWYVRSDIVWHKPNPMPESVSDRPTKSHEYLFLLTRSDKYWYDAKAIREPGVIPAGTKAAKGSAERARYLE